MPSVKKIKYFYKGRFDPKKLSKDNIDRLSTDMVDPNTKVLELGAATGFMGKYLTRVKKCQVTGVDVNPNVNADITGNLDDPTTWKKIKAKGKFDVVLASAVLEHLVNPKKALQRIKKILKPKGILVITLPNIAHWRMRLNLLLGHWQYEDYGILDKTHLHFYTYFTAKALIKAAGFKIIKVAIDPAGGIKYLNWLFKAYPNFYAHQIAIKAQKD